MTFVMVFVGVVLFTLGSWYFSADNRLKRALRAARPWAIGVLPESTFGRVVGEARRLDRVLESPLTRRPCLYYVAKIEEDRGGDWKTLVTESEGVPFLLVDGTGRAIVDPSGAEVALMTDRTSTSGTFDDPTPDEQAFLDKHEQEGVGWLFNKKIRYTEAVIVPGELVAILGSGVREPDPEGVPAEGYRSAPPTRLRLSGSRRQPLLISDDSSITDAALSMPGE